ncbi:MAG: corrinoid protein [Actinobacteria bacterium]|nr:corrinoid protein [Actinomycetota bacterium]MBE3093127.1 corrinoid protein [Chloroflexota bacterium]MBE3128876.1 corrinoid protein [Actinomycetota bacterium]
MAKYQELADSIIKGDNVKSKEIARKLVDEGVSAVEILNDGLMPGMDVVGKKFKANEFYIPEVLIAARAMHAAMDIIKPLLSESGADTKGKIIIGTVQGDLHDIGKNLVGMMLEGGGYTVIDLGADVPAEKFVEEIKKNGVKLIGLSALLTTTMIGMKTVIDILKADKETVDVKVMVGGAPLNQEYADSIDADGYAPDASGAVDLANELLS